MNQNNETLSKFWFLEMKVGVLFKRVGHPEEHPLIKVFSHDLKSERKVSMAEPARNRDRGNSRHIDRDGMDIG